MQPDYMEARLKIASLGCKLFSSFAQKCKLKVLRQHEEKNGSNKICFGTGIICVVVVAVNTKPKNVFQKKHYREGHLA